jgi:hypothetical protein
MVNLLAFLTFFVIFLSFFGHFLCFFFRISRLLRTLPPIQSPKTRRGDDISAVLSRSAAEIEGCVPFFNNSYRFAAFF